MLFNTHVGVVAGSSSLTVYVPGAMSPLLVLLPIANEKSAGAEVLPSQLCSNGKVCAALPVPVLLTTMRAFWSLVYVHVTTWPATVCNETCVPVTVPTGSPLGSTHSILLSCHA